METMPKPDPANHDDLGWNQTVRAGQEVVLIHFGLGLALCLLLVPFVTPKTGDVVSADEAMGGSLAMAVPYDEEQPCERTQLAELDAPDFALVSRALGAGGADSSATDTKAGKSSKSRGKAKGKRGQKSSALDRGARGDDLLTFAFIAESNDDRDKQKGKDARKAKGEGKDKDKAKCKDRRGKKAKRPSRDDLEDLIARSLVDGAPSTAL